MKKIITAFLLVMVLSFGMNVPLAKAESSDSNTIQILETLLSLNILSSEQTEIIELVLQIMKVGLSSKKINYEDEIDEIEVKLDTEVNYSNDGKGGFVVVSLEGNNENLKINHWNAKIQCDGNLFVQGKNGENLCGKDYVFYKYNYFDVTEDITWFTLPTENRGNSTGYLIINVSGYDDFNNKVGYDEVKIKFSSREEDEDDDSNEKQNLSISNIDIKNKSMDFGSQGAVLDQHITVTIKNNQFGSTDLSGKYVDYKIYLYSSDSKEAIKKVASGKVLIPYVNGYSEFSAYFEGGLPFDGENYEREYRAQVQIDTSDDLDESNEEDNKSFSDDWKITHYKG